MTLKVFFASSLCCVGMKSLFLKVMRYERLSTIDALIRRKYRVTLSNSYLLTKQRFLKGGLTFVSHEIDSSILIPQLLMNMLPSSVLLC